MGENGKEYKVYAYCDPRHTNDGKGYKYEIKNGKFLFLKMKPFYIGCARYHGYKRHLAKKSESFIRKRIKRIRKSGVEPKVKILKTFSSTEKNKAFKLEELLITKIGRKDLKKGPLLNLTNGPCGAKSGKENPFYGKHHTEKTVMKIKDTLRGKLSGEKNPMFGRRGELCPFFGKTHTDKSKEKCRMISAILSWKDVTEIRRLSYVGSIMQQDIADMFNVSKSCINHIVQGYTWNLERLSKKEIREKFL